MIVSHIQPKIVFVVVSTRTKNKVLSGELKGYVRTIDPETFDYESEEGILNCFGTIEQAKVVQKALEGEKQLSILALTIPGNCVVPRTIDRKGHLKTYVADCVERRLNVRNYLGTFWTGAGEVSYLIMADMSCLMDVFDPEILKEKQVQAKEPAGKKKKPEQKVTTVVREAFNDVLPQTDTRREPPAEMIPLLWGMLFGFIIGITASRIVHEYPFMSAASLAVIAAGLLVVWMYGRSDRLN